MIVALLRLTLMGMVFGPLVAVALASWQSERNLQKCWAKHGVTFSCYGDGKYDPNRSFSVTR